MITTVTTVTTVSMVSLAGLSTAILAITIAALLVLLITEELAGTRGSVSHMLISKFVNVGILPLIITFAVIHLERIVRTLT